MVVATQHHRSADFAAGYGVVEGQCYAYAAFGVGVEYTCLAAHHHLVFGCLAYPVQVVEKLPADFLGSFLGHVVENFGGKFIGLGQVFGLARSTYPAEGAEAVVEETRAHYILYV